MATTKYKLRGKNVSIKKVCELLDVVKNDLSLAIRPQKSGGGFREDSEIMNMCIANACRTVSTLYVSASPDAIAKDATNIATKAGFVVIDKKLIDDLRKFYHSTDKWQEIAGFVTKSGSNKLFEKMNAALETALMQLLTSGNKTKLDRFCQQWLDMPSGTGMDCRKEIEEEAVFRSKINSQRTKRISTKKKFVPQKAWDKYIKTAQDRWGALGSLFFQIGKKFYQKLRLDSDTKKKIGAPVNKKFVKKFYETVSDAVTANADRSSIVVSVISRVVEAMPHVRGGIEKACAMAAEYWGKKAETALAIKFSGLEV